MSSSDAFLRRSSEILETELLPRVRLAVESLGDEGLWWRPNEASNSAGNLVLHMAGNLRQWVVSGVGDAPDRRRRAEEFRRSGGSSPAEVLEGLEAAVADARSVLARTPAERLVERRVIQEREVTVLQAVYHAVEHFAMHAGQIFYIAKLRGASDLGFYEIRDGVPRPTWKGGL